MVPRKLFFTILFLAIGMSIRERNLIHINEKSAKDTSLRGFEVQVSYILKQRQVDARDFLGIYRALDDIVVVLRTLWPDAKLEPYGSRFTGLATVASDLDCFIKLSASQKTNESELVEMAATVLEQYPHLFSPIVARSHAVVPIVKTVHVPTSRDVDINFNGLSNTPISNYYLHLDDRAFKLTVIIRYWMELQKVNGETTVPNFITSLLSVFYLQQKKLLPSVAELQANAEPDIRNHWNHAFENKDYRPNNDSNLFELLVGLFEYYANFAFDKYVISTFFGYPVGRKQFANYKSLPKEFELYKLNVGNNLTHAINVSDEIIIQNPFIHNVNVAFRMSHQESQKVIVAFKKANIMYQTNHNPDEYLISILRKL